MLNTKQYEKAAEIFNMIIRDYPDTDIAGYAENFMNEEQGLRRYRMNASNDDSTPDPGLIPISPDDPIPPDDPVQKQYDIAYSRFASGDYKQASTLFYQFIEQHPRSNLADNANYWLGECRYVMGDFYGAINFFRELLSTYSSSEKAPDAMLKIGYCYSKMGVNTSARKYLEKLINLYPGTEASGSAAIKLEQIRQEEAAASEEGFQAAL